MQTVLRATKACATAGRAASVLMWLRFPAHDRELKGEKCIYPMVI